MNSLVLNDFRLVTTWKMASNCDCWWDGSPIYVVDSATGRRYLNEGELAVSFKCVLLTCATPLFQSANLLLNLAYRVARLITGNSFYLKDGAKDISFNASLMQASEDVLRIILTPITFLLLEMAAIYGIVSPYNGRKLYASLECAMYEGPMLAPCFQPIPTYHAVDGNKPVREAF